MEQDGGDQSVKEGCFFFPRHKGRLKKLTFSPIESLPCLRGSEGNFMSEASVVLQDRAAGQRRLCSSTSLQSVPKTCCLRRLAPEPARDSKASVFPRDKLGRRVFWRHKSGIGQFLFLENTFSMPLLQHESMREKHQAHAGLLSQHVMFQRTQNRGQLCAMSLATVLVGRQRHALLP